MSDKVQDFAQPDLQDPPTGSFADFANEIESHYSKLISKASVAPKDAYEHWQGITFRASQLSNIHFSPNLCRPKHS